MLLGLTILLVLLAWLLGNTHLARSLLLDPASIFAPRSSMGARKWVSAQAVVESNRYWQWLRSWRHSELHLAVITVCPLSVGTVGLQSPLASRKLGFDWQRWIGHGGWSRLPHVNPKV